MRTLLIKLYTFWEKYVTPVERTVNYSEEIKQKQNKLPIEVQEAVCKMAEWVHDGIDINCFQSRGLRGKGSRDYQNMMYGIIHLHLSAKKDDTRPVVKKDGFAKSGKYLLYASFTKDQAYFIDVREHPKNDDSGKVEWTSRSLLEIIVHNWPDLRKMNIFKGAVLCDSDGNQISIDDNMIAQLAKNHINMMIPVEGGLYIPSFGYMNSGDSASVAMKVNRIINEAVQAQITYERNPDKIQSEFKRMLKKYGRDIPEEYDLHYEYIGDLKNFAIIDRNSKIAWDFRKNLFHCLS